MKSIKELYRIGTGPSSSHTMAPRRAAEQFLARHPEAAAFRVTLYGSLAATGRGHMTDRAIIDTLLPTAPVDIVWQAREFLPFHPNGMRFQALDTAGTPTDTWTVYSIGGGELAEEGVPPRQAEEIYEMNTLDEILADIQPDVAVLCVPKAMANDVANEICSVGVKAIWNFTNTELQVKDAEPIIENIHFSDSLLALGYYIAENQDEAEARAAKTKKA